MRLIKSGLLLVSFGLCLSGGCKEGEPPAASQGPGTGSVNAPVVPEAPPAPTIRPSLLDATFLELVPAEALAIAAVGKPGDLLERLGGPAAAAIVKPLLEELGFGERMLLAALDPARWAEVGLDAKRPAGAAWIGVERPMGAFYVGVTDAAVLERAIRSLEPMLEDTVEIRRVAGAVLLSLKRMDEVVLVLRDGYAILVAADRDKDAKALAERIAGIEARHTVTAAAPYKASLAELGAGADVSAFLDWKALGDEVHIATARAPVELAGAILFGRSLYAGSEGMAFGFDVTEAGIEGVVTWSSGKENPIRKALSPGTGPFSIATVASEHPLYLLAARVHPAAALALVEDGLRASGELRGLTELRNGLRSEMGVDFDKEILPLLTGEAGVAVTGDVEAALKAEHESRGFPFGGSLVVGLTDGPKCKAILAKVFAKLSEEVRPAASIDGWSIPTRDDRSIFLAVVGNGLVASFSEAVVAGFATAKGSLFEKSPPLAALAGRESLSALMSVDFNFMGTWALAGKEQAKAATARTATGLPETPEVIAKRKALSDLQKQLEDLHDAKNKAEKARMLSISKAFGTLAVGAEPSDNGIVFKAALHAGGPLIRDAVKLIATETAKVAADSRAHYKQAEELWEQQNKLRGELELLQLAPPTEVIAPIPAQGILPEGVVPSEAIPYGVAPVEEVIPDGTPPAEVGEIVYRRFNCHVCHSTDGSAGVGPTFKDLYGRVGEPMADGTTVDVSGDYIRQSIEDPFARVVKGFGPVMPSYKGQLKDAELQAVIEYLKTLSHQPRVPSVMDDPARFGPK